MKIRLSLICIYHKDMSNQFDIINHIISDQIYVIEIFLTLMEANFCKSISN